MLFNSACARGKWPTALKLRRAKPGASGRVPGNAGLKTGLIQVERQVPGAGCRACPDEA